MYKNIFKVAAIALFLSLPFSLHAQSKALKGTAIIGAGKVIKNSKTFQNTKDVVRASLGTNTENIEDKDNLEFNESDLNQNSNNHDDKDIFTSTLLDVKSDFIKSNQKNINKIEKSAKDIKNLSDNIASLFGGNSATNGADPNKNNNKSDFTKVSGEKVGSEAKNTVNNILDNAAKNNGNFGLGSSTYEEAINAGKSWVGSGYRIASDGKTMISSDGLRQFRPPSYKPKLNKTQANFEWRKINQGQWQGNGHLDIIK